MNGMIFFFWKILYLFVNFVHSASFRYKRKASKIGGGMRRDFKYPNFPTLK